MPTIHLLLKFKNMNVEVNYVALLAAGIFSMIWGMIYYGPLFGKTWMKLAGVPDKKPKTEEMIKSMFLGFISYAVMAYVLTYFIDLGAYATWQDGARVGFWAWLGFIATTSMGSVLWEGKSWSLYFLNNVWALINIMVIGAMVAVWI